MSKSELGVYIFLAVLFGGGLIEYLTKGKLTKAMDAIGAGLWLVFKFCLSLLVAFLMLLILWAMIS